MKVFFLFNEVSSTGHKKIYRLSQFWKRNEASSRRPPPSHKYDMDTVDGAIILIVVTTYNTENILLRTFILKSCDRLVERGLKGGVSDDLSQ